MFGSDQASLENFVLAIFFAVAAACVLIATAGLALIDTALGRQTDALENWIGKFVAGSLSAIGFAVFGYGVWEAQNYHALGVPNAWRTALGDWWIGGHGMTAFGQNLDPKAIPQAEVYQVFAAFFFAFAFFFGALIHSAVAGRVTRKALYPLAFVIGAAVFPFTSWLFWGSASPLTNRGLSDYVGVYSVYLFVGGFSVVVSRSLGRRRWVGEEPTGEPWLAALGVMLLMFALPVIILGSGYYVIGTGYFGISMTSGGFGLTLVNSILAFFVGTLVGALLAYRRHEAQWALLGPIAGYIAVGAILNFADPWVVALCAVAGPVAALATHIVLDRLNIDDPKIGPLTLGSGFAATIVSGFVGWGTKTGGFFGGKPGYELQHARIEPLLQIGGGLLSVAIGALVALAFIAISKAFNALEIDAAAQAVGLDAHWEPAHH